LIEKKMERHRLSGGEPPVRIQNTWNILQKYAGRLVSIEELASHFSNAQDPYKTAMSAIVSVNKALEEHDAPFILERQTVYKLKRRTTKS
jgi:hypothetical protein